MPCPHLYLLALCLLIGACASAPTNTRHEASAAAQPATAQQQSKGTQKNEAGFADALVAPLADLNLIRTPIPSVLAEAQKAPYAEPEEASCTGLGLEVAELNRVLGADLDTPPSADNPSLLERGSDLATHAVIDAVRNSTTGILPFRGWIRRFTGAEKHARAVIAAISAGAVRRAYLKGLGQAQGCPQPAAPALTQAAPAPSPTEAIAEPEKAAK